MFLVTETRFIENIRDIKVLFRKDYTKQYQPLLFDFKIRKKKDINFVLSENNTESI